MNKPPWLLAAEKDKGQEEWPGSWQDNPLILKMFKETTYHATHDEVPWCSAAVNYWMKKAGVKGSRSAAAVSWLNWGEDLGEEPELGCVVVLEWSNGSHHVALYQDGVVETGMIKCLGGNQGNMVKESWFPVSAVMSYRWPTEKEGYHG